jgi:hypothetical protein
VNARTKLASLVVCATFGACHQVVLDPIPPVSAPPLARSGRYEIDPASTYFEYSLRSFAAGIANKWIIHVGEGLMNYAHSYLGPALPAGTDMTIMLAIDQFEVDDHRARLNLRAIVRTGDVERLNRVYTATGNSYFKRTAVTGVFGMAESMRKTTDEAMRGALEQFLADLRAQMNSWPAQ